MEQRVAELMKVLTLQQIVLSKNSIDVGLFYTFI